MLLTGIQVHAIYLNREWRNFPKLVYQHCFNKIYTTVQKFGVSNKCCSFELSVHQRIPPKINDSFHKKTFFNIDNNKKHYLQGSKFHLTVGGDSKHKISQEQFFEGETNNTAKIVLVRIWIHRGKPYYY